MKRSLICILAGAMLLSLAACGGKENAPPPPDHSVVDGTPDAPPKEPDTPNVPDTPTVPDTPEPPADGGKVEDGVEDGKEEDVPENSAAGDSPAPVTEVQASHTDVTFRSAGSSFRLRPQEITGAYTARFASEDETIATVDENGRVAAVSPGTTHVTMEVEQAGERWTFSCIIRCIWKEEAPAAPEEPTGPEEPEVPVDTPPADSGVDLAAFYETITGQYEFGRLQAFEGDLLANYYPGLENISTNQLLVMGVMMTFNNGEFCLAEVSDSGDVETVKGIFQARIQYMIDGGAWYPGPTAQWTSNSRVVSNGNYVMMVVHENCEEIVEAFQALF